MAILISKKKCIQAIILLCLVAEVSSASAAGVNFPVATNLTIDGSTYVILAGSAATEPLIKTDTTLTVSAGVGNFYFTSPNGFTLTNTGTIGYTCIGAGGGTTQVVVPTGTTTTFTPTTGVVCPAPEPTLMIGSYPFINVPDPGCSGGNLFSTMTGQACRTVIAGCDLGNLFSPITGQSCATNYVAVSPIPSSYNFGLTTLRNGSRGVAVMELQRFLNRFLNLGLVVDGILGPKTLAVIKTWQAANGLVADGLVGPKTKAKMNAQVQ